ncbi:MAG: OprO/OprP family phosphate-selective porin [Muribaculaceae bacterium]|nr:OprO/OprP family phosphate-selective porin [Muribaculaceae bacterium]
MKNTLLTLAASSLCIFSFAFSASADDSIAAPKPKLEFKPTGRVLMDGAFYIGGNHGVAEGSDTRFVDGVAIPDVRLGAKFTYGKWKAKIDVGFSYGKVGLKDTYFEYDFNSANLVRVGYFVPQWGLNSETSSSMKQTYEEPTSNEFFNANPRLLALMWVYDAPKFFAGTSAFVEAGAMTQNANVMGRQAWGAQTRLVWRPRHADGDVVQVGASLHYSKPNADDHTGFNYTANFPSRVSKVPLLAANIDHASGTFKLTPEFLLIKNRFALESQYYYMNVARKDGLNNYQAHGVYGILRGLLIGKHYNYSHADAGVATPTKGSLELALGYNYTDASDGHAGIHGGVMHDANCTLNYYINNWMLARLRYSYTTVHDRLVEGMLPSRHVNTIEARLQIIF